MQVAEDDSFAPIMRRASMIRAIGTVLSFLLAACKQPSDAPPAASAQPPVTTPPTPPAPTSTPPSSATPSASSGALDASIAAPPVTSTIVAPDAAAAVAPTSDPPPAVKLTSIGMHVAGGPYDDATKQPFLRAVEPHYPELARCWKHVTKPKQGDVGVDLQIEAGGGKARVSNPRTTLAGEGLVPCVVSFFESIEFEKTNAGRRVVSYSVRFTPK